MRNILLAAAAISAIAAPAFAQSGPDARGYGSLGYTHLEGDSATTGAVTGPVTSTAALSTSVWKTTTSLRSASARPGKCWPTLACGGRSVCCCC